MMPKIIRYLFTFTALICVLIASLIYLLTDFRPLVEEPSLKDPKALISIKNHIKATLLKLNSDHADKEVVFTHQQIDQLMAYLSHSFSYINARYNHLNSELFLAASLRLPDNPVAAYINVSTEFTDNQDLLGGTTSIGSLQLSNGLFVRLMLFFSDFLLDDKIIELSDYSLKHSFFDDKQVTLLLPPGFNFKQLTRLLKTDLKGMKSMVWSPGKFAGVDHYYHLLQNFSSYTQGISNVSLLEYIKPLLIEARRLSGYNPPHEENFKALLALALFSGDYELRNVISQITNFYPNGKTDTSNITLASRKDLMLHFIYSCSLQILADSQLSFAIGEAKEILDMGTGGSGFSFADLAFDRAGIRFALLATEGASQAAGLQAFISSTTRESDLVPDLVALEENIQFKDFEKNYKNTASAEYQAMVLEIDRRINRLPLYRSFQ